MRNINFDAPLSEDDKQWLRDRDRHKEIARNEARFGDSEDLDADEDKKEAPEYDKWPGAELKAEAKRRDLDISGMTKKAEVAQALREDDARQAQMAAEAAGA